MHVHCCESSFDPRMQRACASSDDSCGHGSIVASRPTIHLLVCCARWLHNARTRQPRATARAPDRHGKQRAERVPEWGSITCGQDPQNYRRTDLRAGTMHQLTDQGGCNCGRSRALGASMSTPSSQTAPETFRQECRRAQAHADPTTAGSDGTALCPCNQTRRPSSPAQPTTPPRSSQRCAAPTASTPHAGRGESQRRTTWYVAIRQPPSVGATTKRAQIDTSTWLRAFTRQRARLRSPEQYARATHAAGSGAELQRQQRSKEAEKHGEYAAPHAEPDSRQEAREQQTRARHLARQRRPGDRDARHAAVRSAEAARNPHESNHAQRSISRAFVLPFPPP